MNDELWGKILKAARDEVILFATLVFLITACSGALFLGQLSKTLRVMMGAQFSEQEYIQIAFWSLLGAQIGVGVLAALTYLAESVSKYNDLLESTVTRYLLKHLQGDGVLTRDSWARRRKQVQRRDGAICQYCEAYAPYGHVDHIIPLSKGGTDDLNNLAWSCQQCNLAKGDKLVDELLQEEVRR